MIEDCRCAAIVYSSESAGEVEAAITASSHRPRYVLPVEFGPRLFDHQPRRADSRALAACVFRVSDLRHDCRRAERRPLGAVQRAKAPLRGCSGAPATEVGFHSRRRSRPSTDLRNVTGGAVALNRIKYRVGPGNWGNRFPARCGVSCRLQITVATLALRMPKNARPRHQQRRLPPHHSVA